MINTIVIADHDLQPNSNTVVISPKNLDKLAEHQDVDIIIIEYL